MKLRKAMALTLAGALVFSAVATGTTSEAAKKTKLKTKTIKVSVGKKKKISITGKKAKHKYTFTSKKKSIAKVSKKGVVTGVKAGKTTITVKDVFKKKAKKLGTIKVTVTKKSNKKVTTTNAPAVSATPVVSATPAVSATPVPSTTPVVSATPEASAEPVVTQTPEATKKPETTKKPVVSKSPKPTPVPTVAPPSPEEQTPTAYKPIDMSTVELSDGMTYDEKTGAIACTDVLEFLVPLGYEVKEHHAVWVTIKGKVNSNPEADPEDEDPLTGFRCRLADSNKLMASDWEILKGINNGDTFEKTFQLVAEPDAMGEGADVVEYLHIKGPDFQTNLNDVLFTSIEFSYPLNDDFKLTEPDNPGNETGSVETGSTETGSTETGSTETGSTEKPGDEDPNLNMVFSADTAHPKGNVYWYINPEEHTYNADGSVSFVLPKEQNKGVGFYFDASKESIDLSKYSKVVVTLSSDKENVPLRYAVSNDATLLYDGCIIGEKNGKIETKDEDTVFECDLSAVEEGTNAYGFVLSHCGWASSVDEPVITIKSIKLIAK